LCGEGTWRAADVQVVDRAVVREVDGAGGRDGDRLHQRHGVSQKKLLSEQISDHRCGCTRKAHLEMTAFLYPHVRLTLKPHVASGVAVAPDPQFVQLDWISVLDGEVVSLQHRAC